MALVNSFAKFYSATYPATSDVLATAPAYGDAVNVLQGSASAVSASDIYDYFTASNREDAFKADVSSVSSDVTAIKTKTDQMVFTNANELDVNAVTGGGGLTFHPLAQ